MAFSSRVFDVGGPGRARDLGLLLLRVGFGLSLAGAHGWGKLQRLLSGNLGFADPLGIGEVPTLFLAVFAEVVCALAVALGLATRWVTVPLVATFVVAFFRIHGGDPFGERELAFAYLLVFSTLFFTGPGRYSLDRIFSRRR